MCCKNGRNESTGYTDGNETVDGALVGCVGGGSRVNCISKEQVREDRGQAGPMSRVWLSRAAGPVHTLEQQYPRQRAWPAAGRLAAVAAQCRRCLPIDSLPSVM